MTDIATSELCETCYMPIKNTNLSESAPHACCLNDEPFEFLEDFYDYGQETANPNANYCATCELYFSPEDYTNHLIYRHPIAMYVLYSTLTPPPLNILNDAGYGVASHMEQYNNEEVVSQTPNVDVYGREFFIMLNEEESEDTDNESENYEALVALCERIGNHTVGIDDVTTITTQKEKATLECDETCAICLEYLIEKETVYDMNACRHYYCSECITKWTSENKLCPVCKVDLW